MSIKDFWQNAIKYRLAGGHAADHAAMGLGAAPGLYNIKPTNMRHWRKSVANVIAGVADAKIACIGDSTTYGAGSTGSGTNNFRAGSWPTRLAALLSAIGIPAVQGSGNWNGSINPVSNGDPRWSLGAGWTQNGTATLGGPLIMNTTTTNVLSFTPGVQFDTIKIWYLQLSGLGTFSVSVDGGASLASVNCSGTTVFTSATVSCPNTSARIDITPTTLGNGFYIALVAVSLSTTKKVLIDNFGWYGQPISAFTGNTAVFSPIPALTAYAPDLTIICHTINDCVAGTAIATYTASHQSVINAAKAGGGDVMLMCGAPSGNTQYPANGAAYVNALKALAISNDIPLIDIDNRWTSYAASNPHGMYYDVLHPSAVGYIDIARAVAQAVTA